MCSYSSVERAKELFAQPLGSSVTVAFAFDISNIETNKFLCHVMDKLKHVDFSFKKGLDVNFRVICEGKNVHFT